MPGPNLPGVVPASRHSDKLDLPVDRLAWLFTGISLSRYRHFAIVSQQRGFCDPVANFGRCALPL